jgi:hypothetical protein
MRPPTYEYGESYLDAESPEQAFWRAVIDRAVKDYCFFFDMMEAYKNHRPPSEHKELVGYKRDRLYLRSVSEFKVLRWFLFSDEMEQYNMKYIFHNFFNSPGGEDAIRRYAAKHFQEHMKKMRAQDRYKAVLDYLNANIHETVDDSIQCTLMRSHKFRRVESV